MNLNERIRATLKEMGADLVGFADVTDLSADMTGGFVAAVSIAVRLDPSVVREVSNGPTQRYYKEYVRVNDLLDKLCRQIADLLTTCGWRARAIEATTANIDARTLSLPVQHKTIATRAGLGWIGKSALLITEEYGPAIRLGSVLTDAELETGEPIGTSRCGECHKCVDRCPAGAIAGSNWSLGDPRKAIYDAFTCRDTAKRLAGRQGIDATICGICINACPWTQKYISREWSGTKIRQMLTVVEAITDRDVEQAKTLLLEYADSLGFDLSFQDFDGELRILPGDYAHPKGCLLLATYGGRITGCAALRPLEEGICEMKRLYVRPEFRGLGIGRALAEAIIKQARELGYSRMRLDTVPSMETARALYVSLGFEPTDSYRYNPIEGAVFMELKLG
jgi:epoxyqueuosine reductase